MERGFFLAKRNAKRRAISSSVFIVAVFLWNTHNTIAHTLTFWGFHTFAPTFSFLVLILNSNAFYVWLLTGSNKYRKLVGTLEYFRYLNSIGNGGTCATCHTIYIKLQPEIVCLFVLSSGVCYFSRKHFVHTFQFVCIKCQGKILFTVQIDIALLMNDVSILTFIHR